MLLYKYRKIDDKYLEAMIRKSEVYFARPSTLNDPYECFPAITVDGVSKRELRRFFKKTIKLERPEWTIKTINSFVAFCMRGSHRGLPKFFRETSIQKLLDLYSVCCFSKNRNDTIMWAHYAKNHTGVCLGWDIDTDQGGLPVKKVHYDKPRLQINWIKQEKKMGSLLHQSFFLKAIDWAYEEEYRAIIDTKEVNTVRIEEGKLKEVIFGINIDPCRRDLIICWCKKLPIKPKLFQASLHDLTYEILIDEIQN